MTENFLVTVKTLVRKENLKTSSDYDVGAPHKRERWFLLAAESSRVASDAKGVSQFGRDLKLDLPDANGKHDQSESGGVSGTSQQRRQQEWGRGPDNLGSKESREVLADSNSKGVEGREGSRDSKEEGQNCIQQFVGCSQGTYAWQVEPDLDRVADGVPLRVDRIKRLGNAVVPAQAKEAFERLMGINFKNIPVQKVGECEE